MCKYINQHVNVESVRKNVGSCVWYGGICWTSVSTCVVLAEQLHPHDGKYEDDNAQYKGQIAECTHCATHDRDQEV